MLRAPPITNVKAGPVRGDVWEAIKGDQNVLSPIKMLSYRKGDSPVRRLQKQRHGPSVDIPNRGMLAMRCLRQSSRLYLRLCIWRYVKLEWQTFRRQMAQGTWELLDKCIQVFCIPAPPVSSHLICGLISKSNERKLSRVPFNFAVWY